MAKILKVSDFKKEGKNLTLHVNEEISPCESATLSVDIYYGEEDEAPYILLSIKTKDAEILAEIPYGDEWEVLKMGGEIVVSDNTKVALKLKVDDFLRGVVFGASRLWEEMDRIYG